MKFKNLITATLVSTVLFSCGQMPKEEINKEIETPEVTKGDDFEYLAEEFADKKVIRYKIPSWDNLSLKQKKYAYYLTQAGYAGREIIYDQNYRHNLSIKRALEKVYTSSDVDKASVDFKGMEIYLKQMWFASGIHHHYSNAKFVPGFSKEFLEEAMKKVGTNLNEEALKAIFDPAFDAKKVNLSKDVDLIKGSAVNFYSPNLTQKEVEDYYKSIIDSKNPSSI